MILKLSASVNSSVLSNFAYNAKSKSLTINFNSGKSYVYENVPPHVLEGMLNAESTGKFYNSFIKGKYRFIEL